MFGEAFGPKAFSSNDVLDPQHPNESVTARLAARRSTSKFQPPCRQAGQLELLVERVLGLMQRGLVGRAGLNIIFLSLIRMAPWWFSSYAPWGLQVSAGLTPSITFFG